jgi:isochorismate pyruvate lyase
MKRLAMKQCENLEEVREQIDLLDQQIVKLLATRSQFVKQAAGFKKTVAEAQAPQRVAQVMRKVEGLAHEHGANPLLIERVYQAIINTSIEMEMQHLANLTKD